MNNKFLSTLLLTIFTINVNAHNELDKQRPDNLDEQQWSSLKAAVLENNSKLLPTPVGIGGKSARFGESVSIDGNRALIGSPTALEHGVAYFFDFNETTNSWVETQLIFPDNLNAENRFGTAVDLQGDRAFITDRFNRVNGAHQAGAVYVYELNNGEWQQTQKLIASDASSTDEFGTSVSLSGDRALIGAASNSDAINGFDSGAAYIFDYDGSDWQETKILIPTVGSSNDGFGNSVSLDADMALVGASNFDDNNNAIETGSAFLFELNGGTWSQSHQFLAEGGVDNDKYGIDVNLSTNRVLIGSSETDENFGNSGSAYVYEYDGSLWIETKLLAPDAATADGFGVTVDIENNRLLIGAINGEVIGVNTGSAYIYDYNLDMDLWELTQEISGDDLTNNNHFATSLSLSGGKVIVGNFNDSNNGSQSGAAYVFGLDGGTWQQSQKLTTQGAVEDNFGYAVSLDGNRALIGAPYDDNDNGFDAGNAYIFDYINGQWSSPFKLQASEYFVNFGMSVSLSGNTAIIGANRIEFAGSGQAYIFEFDGSNWNETALLERAIFANDEFGISVSMNGDRALVGSSSETGIVSRSGTVYVYEKSINGWLQTDTLMASDGATFDGFGISVSLLEDRAIVGAISKDDDINGLSRAGAAYIYDYDSMSGMWVETKLQVSDPHANDFVGSSVDLDNNRAIVGARNGFGASSQTGSVYIFDYDTDTDSWSDTKIIASDGQSISQFGGTVSLDGNRALVGAYNTIDNSIRSGSAYLYEYDGNVWNEVIKYIPNDAGERDNYGFSVSLSGSSVLIGSIQDDDRGTDSGSVYTIIDTDILFSDGFENLTN